MVQYARADPEAAEIGVKRQRSGRQRSGSGSKRSHLDVRPGGKKAASVKFTPTTGSLLSPYSNTISYNALGLVSSQSTLISGKTFVTSTTYDQFRAF